MHVLSRSVALAWVTLFFVPYAAAQTTCSKFAGQASKVVTVGNTCYYGFSSTEYWDNAQTRCESQGTHLVHLQTITKQRDVYAALGSDFTQHWMGLVYLNSEWKWYTNTQNTVSAMNDVDTRWEGGHRGRVPTLPAPPTSGYSRPHSVRAVYFTLTGSQTDVSPSTYLTTVPSQPSSATENPDLFAVDTGPDFTQHWMGLVYLNNEWEWYTNTQNTVSAMNDVDTRWEGGSSGESAYTTSSSNQWVLKATPRTSWYRAVCEDGTSIHPEIPRFYNDGHRGIYCYPKLYIIHNSGLNSVYFHPEIHSNHISEFSIIFLFTNIDSIHNRDYIIHNSGLNSVYFHPEIHSNHISEFSIIFFDTNIDSIHNRDFTTII
ncbi:hypothetical protein C0Q70_03827 [Pomacea canaliculata]|uniref:C-type lectin domain-containing protein n=1 Tax=Pomacea canaliculata TaxID=400727 RepID=A0A2T7PTX9_POMCA|nr:hypothetical protein C0Q70_03827 [Pomacea canaliculata]